MGRSIHAFFAENIIGSNAGLPTVEIFAKYNALGCKLDIGTGIYNAGTLAAQLQYSRCQMLCRYR